MAAWLPGGALQGSPGLPSRIRSLCSLWIAATQRDGVTLSGPVIVTFPRGHRRGAELFLLPPSWMLDGMRSSHLRSLSFIRGREWPVGSHLTLETALPFPEHLEGAPGLPVPQVCFLEFDVRTGGLRTFLTGLPCNEKRQTRTHTHTYVCSRVKLFPYEYTYIMLTIKMYRKIKHFKGCPLFWWVGSRQPEPD